MSRAPHWNVAYVVGHDRDKLSSGTARPLKELDDFPADLRIRDWPNAA